MCLSSHHLGTLYRINSGHSFPDRFFPKDTVSLFGVVSDNPVFLALWETLAWAAASRKRTRKRGRRTHKSGPSSSSVPLLANRYRRGLDVFGSEVPLDFPAIVERDQEFSGNRFQAPPPSVRQT